MARRSDLGQRIGDEFGNVLAIERMRRGLTQKALAAEAELNRSYPSLIERGLRTPTIEIVFRLAKALETTPARLLQLTDERVRGQVVDSVASSVHIPRESGSGQTSRGENQRLQAMNPHEPV